MTIRRPVPSMNTSMLLALVVGVPALLLVLAIGWDLRQRHPQGTVPDLSGAKRPSPYDILGTAANGRQVESRAHEDQRRRNG
jgi:hypothetical protein